MSIDSIREATVEEFVKWLRGQKRTRNGAAKGKRDTYKLGGVKFILSTCRTAFRWAGRHRMLPPFAENPFSLFPIEKLRDPNERTGTEMIFTAAQEASFFAACSIWQRSIFKILATYGLRVGELTHLLIDDVDLSNDVFVIRSKPWLFWSVKTGRERRLPLLPETKDVIASAIGDRKVGFVFLNEDYCADASRCDQRFRNMITFRSHIEGLVADNTASTPGSWPPTIACLTSCSRVGGRRAPLNSGRSPR